MVTAAESIRLEDLREPVPTEAHKKQLQAAADDSVELTSSAVLTTAQEQTGLDDFGSEGFRPRLEYWLDLVASEPSRTSAGRLMIFDRCVSYATTRLRLNDLLRRHPEIHSVQIQQPIVVVGPQRSGTTHLVNLLARDSRLRSLPLWEGYEPIPAANERVSGDEHDPRFARCRAEWRRNQAIIPYMEAMHPLDPGHIHDEIELQGPNFASCLLDSMAIVYRRRKEDDENANREHYEYLHTMLKALTWYRGPTRWVLKSPDHGDRLSHLAATFPDATIVMTHRDPIAMVQSVATMMAYYARLSYTSVDVDAVLSYWTHRIETILHSLVNGRRLIPEHRVVDVLFHEFMADKIGTIRRIYSTAGLELTDKQRQQMAGFLVDHPRAKHGRVNYDLQANFGVDPAAMRSRFAFYMDCHPVQSEIL